MMTLGFFTTARIAGILLLLSLLLILGALGLIIAQGKLPGMSVAFRGVGPEIGDASALRTIGWATIPYLMAQLSGYTLFTILLYEIGDRGVAVVALTLLVFSATLGAVEGSFQASVTVWAANEATRTGVTPEFYEPLRRWVNGTVQLAYMSFQLTALLLYSWAALQTGLLAPWIGWVVLVWSLLAFPLYFFAFGAPLIVMVTHLLFGIGLLL